MNYSVIEYGDLEVRDAEVERMKDIEECAKNRPGPDESLLEAARDPFHKQLVIEKGNLGVEEKREVAMPRILWLWLEGVGMVKKGCGSRAYVVDEVLHDAVFALSEKIMLEPVPENVATEDDWANGYDRDRRRFIGEELLDREQILERHVSSLRRYAQLLKMKLEDALNGLRDALAGSKSNAK